MNPVFTVERLASVSPEEIADLLNACYQHDLDSDATMENRVYERMQKLFGNMRVVPRYRCDCGNAMTQNATTCHSCWKKICTYRSAATMERRRAGARRRNFVSDEELNFLHANIGKREGSRRR